MAKDIYKDLYGSAYKSQKTKNAAEKRKKTMSRNDLIKKATYEKQFTSDVQSYAKKNNIQYSDRLKTAAELYYKNKSVGEKFQKQSIADSVRRQKQEVKSNASFMNKDTGGFQEKEYNRMRKEIGLNKDDSVTKKKFDDITATFNRMKQLKGSTSSKEVGPSFSKKLDKTLDKGLSTLGKLVKKPFHSVVDPLMENKVTGGAIKGVLKGIDKAEQYTIAPLKNIAATNTKALKEAEEQVKDGKKLKSMSYKDAVNPNTYKKDFTDAYSNKRRSTIAESRNNAGITTGSKYGDKALDFAIEGTIDPLNYVGVGVAAKGIKGLKGINKTKQVEEIVKELPKREQNLKNIQLPQGKIEVQPTVKKSLTDLMNKNATPGNIETPKNEIMNIAPQKPTVLNETLPINQPVSRADNLQNVVTRARETNDPKDIESIRQHTQELIDDLDTNYKDEDIEEVKDALAKLNLQLFSGNQPVEEVLNNINGVVERAKTLKKDIKVTNPQLAQEIQGIKDINTVGKASRNLFEVVDKLPKQLQKEILPVLNKSKVDNVNYQKMYVQELDANIVNPKTGLGIKKGSKESALIQDYGEKTLAKKELEKQGFTPEQINQMNPEELSKLNDEVLMQQRPNDYQKIMQANDFFGRKYKELLDAANGTLAKIYPGQPDKLIPERSDYFHHFNEMEGLSGVINQFRTPENINPDLVTISHGTKPKTKWQAFRQKRGLGEYKSDAVGGFLKYIQGVSHTTNVDPVIPAIRNVVKDLQNATEDTKNINNIIESLNDHVDDIAGKTNPYDRTLQKGLGRANFRRLNAINGRVKSNMILGNIGSTVAQVGNLPLIAAKAKHHLAPGLYDTLEQFSRYATKNNKNLPIHKSNFLKERFIDEDFSKFDTRILDQPKKLAVKLMTMVDKASSSLAWNSFYREALSKKVPNPIKYADEQTRKTLAGRGIGEMGMGQKSKTAQIFMPFTYEVGHQWKVLGDMVGKKDAAGIMTFLLTSYALNKVIEDVRGSGVSFDPIDALIDGYENGEGGNKEKVLAALGSLSGEVVGNIPGGSSLTGAVGDKGILGTDVSLDDIFQDRNPNRFGSGLTVSKAVESPSFALLPFGANQVKKVKEGYETIRDGGVYNKKGEIMYPVDTSSKLKKAQLLTFGKYSPSEAREYFEEKRKPMSAKRTNEINKAENKFEAYNNQLIQLTENRIKRNAGDTDKIKELNKQLEKLREKNKK